MSFRLNNSFFRLSNGVFRYVTVSGTGAALTYTISELLTTTGAGTWTKPEGITSVTVECWGGGGAGGGCTSTNAGGGGGAGAQYSRKVIIYSTDSTSISYNIGAGGVGGTGDGPSGGDSTWNTNEVVAKGGVGGLLGTTSSPGGGGSIGGGIGDIVYKGGDGDFSAFIPGAGNPDQAAGGNGGGGAGSLEDGLFTTGGNELGGTGGSQVLAVLNGGVNGNPGSIYGGGGSGAAKLSGANRIGGDGAQGLIRVSYTIPPPLDTYTGSIAAFSVRKLTDSASFCMEVTRDSDSTTQNIGFQSDGLIDTGSLLTFVGSGTGYVTKWYNQMRDDNATVPFGTTFQSPYIVSSGSLMTMNGKPSVFYNSLAGLITTASILTDANGLWSTYTVGQVVDTATRLMVRTVYNVPVTNIAQNIRRNTTNIESIGYNTGGGTGTDLGPSNPGTSQHIAYAQRTSANVEVYVNGATNGATAVAGTPATGSGTQGSISLGFFGGAGSTPSFPWSGSIQEVIHFPQDPSTFNYRTNLTSILNAYYGTF